MDKYNSQWVSFHIRDRLKDGEVTVQNTVIEGYVLPPLIGFCVPILMYYLVAEISGTLKTAVAP